ncbi:hypothetical protein CRG98_010289 [Punica granatum]|uniref:Uncharacterized protein n=1 Tax=Punica granatum TaxID=22663 RepID=A0A2I0KLB3_PUNGR|nr:hypothetical protein CRG98_010289 [Punica granatum]
MIKLRGGLGCWAELAIGPNRAAAGSSLGVTVRPWRSGPGRAGLLGRGDLDRAALGFWVGPVCSTEIWTRLEEKMKKWRRGEGGRVVGELELRVRRGSLGFFGRGRATGLGREVELVVSRPWASCGSRREVKLGVSRGCEVELWVSARSRAGSLRA